MGGYKNTITDINGNVGINIAEPIVKFQVHRSDNTVTQAAITNSGTGDALLYFDASNGDLSGSDYMWIGQTNSKDGEIFMPQSSGTFYIKSQPGGTAQSNLSVTQAGGVAIGTDVSANAVNNLEVHGQARFNGAIMVGDSNVSNVVSSGVNLHVKSSSEAVIRLEDLDSTNVIFDLAANYGSGFKIRESNDNNVRLFIESSTGSVKINGTSPTDKLHVGGRTRSEQGFYSAYGVYTDGGTYTNQWQKVCSFPRGNAFAFANAKILISEAGQTSGEQLHGEVYFSYKYQSNNGRVNVNIYSYGERTLLASNIEFLFDSTNNVINMYHKVTANYSRPFYTLLNYTGNGVVWINTIVGSDVAFASEPDTDFTEYNKKLAYSNDPVTGKTSFYNDVTTGDASNQVMMGTTTPQSNFTLDVRGNAASAETAIGAYSYGGEGSRAVLAQGYATSTTQTGINYGLVARSTGTRANAGGDDIGTNIAGHFTAAGADNNYALITSTGKVGIGNSAPDQLLSVGGTMNSDSNGSYYGAWLSGNSASGGDSTLGLGTWWNNAAYITFQQSNNPHRLSIYTHLTQDHVAIQENGGMTAIGHTTPQAMLDVQPTTGNRKVTRIANDVTSTYFYNTQADAVLEWTCGSYYQSEVVITANQTNGGTYNNLYIRGIWSNNHESHHWDELERVGYLTSSSFTMSVGQNTVSNSGKLTLDFNYTSASFAQLNVRVTDFYGTHSYTIT